MRVAVVDEAVERRQQRRAAGEGLVERGGVRPPLPLQSVDRHGYAGVPHRDLLTREDGCLGAGYAERPESSLLPAPPGLVGGKGLEVGVDAVGDVPEPLPSDTSGDSDLSHPGQQLEHLGDVAVVRPAGGVPRQLAGVRHVAGEQRPGVAQAGEDVAPEAVVRLDPCPNCEMRGVAHLLGDMERHGGHRPDVGNLLEKGPVLLQRPRQIGRRVRRSEPAPRDEVGVRCDRGRRVDLQQGQLVDKGDQLGRPGGVEQLGLHGKLSRLVAVEPSHAHSPRLIGGQPTRSRNSRDRCTTSAAASASYDGSELSANRCRSPG